MKSFTKIVLLLTLAFAFINVNAQFRDYGFKLGLQFNGVMPLTEFESDNGLGMKSYLARGFVRLELFSGVNAELGAGWGNLQGDEFDYALGKIGPGSYSTSIIPIDLRIVITPIDAETWNPYLYAGAGIMNYNVGILPTNPSPENVASQGWATIFPAGVGTEILIAEGLILDLSAGATYTVADALNAFKIGDMNDAYINIGAGIIFTGENMDSDDDNDGLTKREELEIGTDPNNPDSDGDGLNDGAEFKKYNTDPLNADSDGDGLNDGDEVLKYKTNPNKPDTDNDGLSDYDEVMTHKTNPVVADTDNDGLNDGDEVNKYKTDPLKSDTDKDGLSDSDEVNKYKTNPLIADTDSDGLNDYEEVMTYKTDPLKVDTDGGTIGDGVEVKRGTNPLDPKDDIVQIDVPIVLDGITFATNKFNITPESETVLNKALKTLRTYDDIVVEISGHTDSDGSNSHNQTLSQNRADAVKAWLVSKGISSDRITSVGYGEDKPRVANDSADNKRMNRRIEFKRIK